MSDAPLNDQVNELCSDVRRIREERDAALRMVESLRVELSRADAAITALSTPAPEGGDRCPTCLQMPDAYQKGIEDGARGQYRRGVEDAAKWIDKTYRLTIDGADASLGNIMRAALTPPAQPAEATRLRSHRCIDDGGDGYDMSIHSNPDAAAWAKFFIESYERGEWGIDEEVMRGWFANAMMAMHDHIKRQPPAAHARTDACNAGGSMERDTTERCPVCGAWHGQPDCTPSPGRHPIDETHAAAWQEGYDDGVKAADERLREMTEARDLYKKHADDCLAELCRLREAGRKLELCFPESDHDAWPEVIELRAALSPPAPSSAAPKEEP